MVMFRNTKWPQSNASISTTSYYEIFTFVYSKAPDVTTLRRRHLSHGFGVFKKMLTARMLARVLYKEREAREATVSEGPLMKLNWNFGPWSC